MNHIRTKNSITLVNGLEAPKTVSSSFFYFDEVCKAVSEGNYTLAWEIASRKEPTVNCPVARQEIDWRKTNPALRKVIDFGREIGEDYTNYAVRLNMNPLARSVEMLFDFQQRWNLPITKEGFILAYKGIGLDDYSVMGNTETVVLKGATDNQGRILNVVGQEVEILRNQVCADPDIGCAQGLHAGSYEYASNWGSKLMLVKIDPANVISVPKCSNFQKIRCCHYWVEQIQMKEISSIGAKFEDGEWREVSGSSWQEDLIDGYSRGHLFGMTVSEVHREFFEEVNYADFERYVINTLELDGCILEPIRGWKVV